MRKASNLTYLKRKSGQEEKPKEIFSLSRLFGSSEESLPKANQDLNVFVLTFEGIKEAEKNLAGGDPYECKKCQSILNKYSRVQSKLQCADRKDLELSAGQSLWQCEFCGYPNIIMIEKEEIPLRDDVVYMLESELAQMQSQNDSTLVFVIDVSGSMNTTSEVAGKMDLKFGISQEEIDMLRQFMEPGDQAQLNALPGAHNQNKTFISRKQCILSAIESQLLQLKKEDPHRRVGFVLFNNQVSVLGDSKSPTVNVLGDKLLSVEAVVQALENFKLTAPLSESFEELISYLNKVEAKGQTALGPAVVAGIQVASKGSKGSTVIVCTDGLSNIGIGSLDLIDEGKIKFYDQLAETARHRNIAISVMAIKGEGCKMEVIGKLAAATNGNVKVVNPEKLAVDFATVLKDEVVGLEVVVKVMLHKAMTFRNEDEANLRDSRTVLIRNFANATVNTKVSFQYEVREEEDLKFMQIRLQDLKKVPFQAQITYTSPKGGKFMRVISSESKTTMERKEMEKEADITVVHQRVTSQTANLFSKGHAKESVEYNNQWAGYLNNNFQQPQHIAQQQKFETKNRRLNEAISNKMQRKVGQMKPMSMPYISSKEEKMHLPQGLVMQKKEMLSNIDQDEDDMEVMNNMMQKQEHF